MGIGTEVQYWDSLNRNYPYKKQGENMLLDLKIVPVENADIILPKIQTKYSACADLAVCFNHIDHVDAFDSYNQPSPIEVETDANGLYIRIYPGERVMLPTGMRMIIPHGYQVKIIPRSGIPWKLGLMQLNSPGTIDSDYIQEVKFLFVNTSDAVLRVNHHDRMGQMEIIENSMKSVRIIDGVEGELINHIEDSTRIGGFGSTGK